MAPRFNGIGMLPVPAIPNIGDKVEPAHAAELYSLSIAVFRKLNGKLNVFGSAENGTQAGNLDAELLDVFFPDADTEVAIPHDLGRVPVGYIPIRFDRAARIYDSNNASWTEKVLYLRSDTAGVNAKFLIA